MRTGARLGVFRYRRRCGCKSSQCADANVGLLVPVETLQQHLREGDQKLEGTAQVSAQMSAVLTGAGFRITPLSPEKQQLALGYPTVWSWTIEAIEAGKEQLQAQLYVIVPTAQIDRQFVRSLSREVVVTVRDQTWTEWFEAVGKEFDTAKTIVVSLFGVATLAAGWFGFSLTRRRKNVQPEIANQTASSDAGP
jgi:hypothetical protein